MKLGRKGEARAVAEQALRLHGKPELENDIRHLLAVIVSNGRVGEGYPLAWVIHDHGGSYGSAAGPDDRRLALGLWNAVEVVEPPFGFVAWRTAVKATSPFAFDTAGKQLFVTDRERPERLRVLDVATGRELRTLALPGRPVEMAVSKSLIAVVFGGLAKQTPVELFDRQTGEKKAALAGAHGPIALSRDGSLVAAAFQGGRGASVGLWRVVDGALEVSRGPLRMLGPSSMPVRRFVFDAAGNTLLAIGGSHIRYDLGTLRRVGPVERVRSGADDIGASCTQGDLDCAVAGAVSADGNVLAFGRKSTVRVIVRAPNVEVRELQPCGHEDVTRLALDAKAALLAAACSNGTAVALVTRGGAVQLNVPAASDPIRHLALGGAGLVIARGTDVAAHARSGGVTHWRVRGVTALAASPNSPDVAWGTSHGVFVVRRGVVRQVAFTRRGVSAVAVSSSAVAWGDGAGGVSRCALPCRKRTVIRKAGGRADPAELICLDPSGQVAVPRQIDDPMNRKGAPRYVSPVVVPRAMACPLDETVFVDGSGRASITGPTEVLGVTVDVAGGGVVVQAGHGRAAAFNGAEKRIRCVAPDARVSLPRECCSPLLSPRVLTPGATVW